MRSDAGPPKEEPSRRKRGRPPHPDILTPREWQVLDLLHRGLTNEQIAQGLDISYATAKYHVSEIISKLGVQTREEAAAWQPEAVSVRWWERLLARLTPASLAKAAVIAGGVAVVAGLAFLAWGVWRTNENNPNLSPATDITIADFHRQISQAATQTDMVLHTTETLDFADSSLDLLSGEEQGWTESWIDVSRGLARVAYRPNSDTVIYLDGMYFYVSAGDISFPVSGYGPACHELSGVATLLMGFHHNECPDSTELLYGRYKDKDVAALRSIDLSRNEDGDPTGGQRVSTIYFERPSYLPMGSEFQVDGFVTGSGATSTTVEFVPRDSLAPDFFSPADVGYVDRCVQHRIEVGGPSCYLKLSSSMGASGSLDDWGFVIAEVIRFSTRPSIDIVQPQNARATRTTAQEATERIADWRERSPYIAPADAVHDFRELPANQPVWFIEAPGVFGDRGGDSPRKPNPPLIAGTLLAVVVLQEGDLVYSAVATN
jgi:DNA-binding CsgD family transcriptional regulator